MPISTDTREPGEHVVFLVALIVVGIAGFLDWRHGKIPNWLTFGVLVLSPLLHAVRFLADKQPMNVAGLQAGYSIVGAIVAAIVPLLLYRHGAMLGGDVKLCAAIGAMLGTMLGIEALTYGFVAGALIGPAKLAYEGKLLATLKNAMTIFVNAFMPKDKRRPLDESTLMWLRLGPALFVGVAMTVYLHW